MRPSRWNITAALKTRSSGSSGGLAYVGCLRTFLPFGDFKFDFITFLQTLVSLGRDGAVVNKHIRSIRTPDKPVAFRVIEPLHRTFQTFHA